MYADAVAALRVLRSHELVDPARVAVAGGSQGGGISTSVAALAPSSVAAALPDVPFLCDFRRAASVALMDQTCRPSTVFAAYHAYGGPKEIAVYEYNDHEGGEAFHRTRQLAWLAATL